MDNNRSPGNDLRTQLNLLDLADKVPCLYGVEECNCPGCAARAALIQADAYLERGLLLDAYLKTGHADYQFDWAPVREAYERLGVALAEAPDDLLECPRCRSVVAESDAVSVHHDPDEPADQLCAPCAAETSLCPAELLMAWSTRARRRGRSVSA